MKERGRYFLHKSIDNGSSIVWNSHMIHSLWIIAKEYMDLIIWLCDGHSVLSITKFTQDILEFLQRNHFTNSLTVLQSELVNQGNGRESNESHGEG